MDFKSTALRRALAGDVERQGRRVRDVETLDASGKIEPRHSVARRARELPQALALRAQHQRQRCAQRRVAEVDIPGAVEADQEISTLAQRLERAGEILHRDDGYIFERA